MQRIFLLSSFLLFFVQAQSQTPVNNRLKVSENQRFLVLEDGTPFFWQADTA